MSAQYQDVAVRAQGAELKLSFALLNQSREVWKPGRLSLGWQFFDPDSHLFLEEGAWVALEREVAPGESAKFELSIAFPPQDGAYEIYVSYIEASEWAYARGESFLRILAESSNGQLRLLDHQITTVRALGWRRFWSALPGLFASPVRTIVQNRRLIRSMARRDILARYRGSFGDVFWTILNPLLLMTTYFFVFGVVLQTRFGPNQSRTGFALYFLAGMLPWLAFSEPVG